MAEVIRSPLGCTTETPSPKGFEKWCSKNKVLWQSCKVDVSETTGRCVVATKVIKKGEVAVEVPDSQVLMAENSQINQLLAEDGLLKPADDALLEVQGLIIAVMYERALGKQSHWEPYLSFLPNDMSHMPIYWTDDELSELRGTAAHDKIIGRVQHPADAPTRMSQLFEELVLPFVQSHDSVCKVLLGKKPDDATEAEARDKLWPQYQWATAVVASYSFVLGDDQYQGMVPVWDLLNHITGKVNVKLHHDADKEVLQMIATEDIPAGAEVVNCYGQLSNAELLRGYGYVEQHNTIKHVQIPAQFLIRAAAAAAAGTRTAAANPAAAAAAGADPEADRSQLISNGDGGDASFDQEVSEDGSGGSSDPEGSDNDDSSDDASDDESSEPDWDLEDDSSDDYVIQPQQQQQQGEYVIPRLAAAQDLIPDWEDRWQLCYTLKLFPKNNIFQIPAGELASMQGNLLAVLLLLLGEAKDCEQLAAAVISALDKAAAAAAGTAAAATARPTAKSSKGKKRKQQQQQGSAEDAVAAVAADAVGKLQKLKFIAQPSHMLMALQRLVALMLSRYTCTLQEDQAKLQQIQQLPPRLAAAVIARSGEKEVLHQLQQDLQQPGVADQLVQSARESLTTALKQLVAAAAAAATEDHCCQVPGCSHDHHDQHHHDHDHDHHDLDHDHDPDHHDHDHRGSHARKKQKPDHNHKRRDSKKDVLNGSSASDEEEVIEGQQQQQGKGTRLKGKGKKQQGKKQKQGLDSGEGQKGIAAAAGGSSGFAFNFQM